MPASAASTREAKVAFLEAVGRGLSVRAALAEAGRSAETTYDRWKKDPEFAAELESIRRGLRLRKHPELAAPERDVDFVQFRERFMGSATFDHQKNIWDVIEGRQPRWMDSSFTYVAGDRRLALINVPPEHAKTETFSIDYPTYRIATNPNIKILLVSKTLERAKEFVYGIQQRLTAPRWRDMQVTFAPGGFKTTDALWRADRFWLGQDLRDSTDKDPTVQALGMRGQIYGARSDLIIVDDAVTLDNASEFEKQIRWLQQEVMTRVGDGGQVVILGTRVDAKDLYFEIVDPTRYPIGVSPWTVLRMPAVLDGTGANPKSWRTLWPRSDRPWAGTSPEPGEDGMFPRWDGPTLNRRRGMIAPKTWAMVYQQQDIPDDGVFQPDLVAAAVNGKRRTGRFTGAVGHAHTSHAGLYVICGLDPAVGGDAGAVVMAVDRATKMRYVLDANVIHNPMPKDLHDLIRAWTDEYQPNEWRIEKNGLNKMLTQDESIRQFLANRGVPMFEHYTTKEVWDADFGVAGMAPLFGYKQDERDASGVHNRIEGRLIELPSTVGSEGVKALVEQLVTWAPQTKNKRDMVMALWFCEVKARELCRERKVSRVSYMPNEFLTPDRERGRVVVDMNDYMTARAAVERFA